jgi:hypothetical protein
MSKKPRKHPVLNELQAQAPTPPPVPEITSVSEERNLETRIETLEKAMTALVDTFEGKGILKGAQLVNIRAIIGGAS